MPGTERKVGAGIEGGEKGRINGGELVLDLC